ncbi:MAG: glycosyltransferase family 87 protein [Acidobacteriota bacterium]
MKSYRWLLVNGYLAAVALMFLQQGVSVLTAKDAPLEALDFVVYYTGAHLLGSEEPQKLYDVEVQKKFQKQLLGHGTNRFKAGVLPYNHPPFETLLFYPFRWMPYRTAFFLWLAVNLLLIVLYVAWLTRTFREFETASVRATLYLGALAFFPFAVCLLQGQDTILFLWLISIGFVCFERGNNATGGVVIGLCFFRFHLAYLWLIPLFLKAPRRVSAALVISLSILAGLSLYLTGIPGLMRYLELLQLVNRPGSLGYELAYMHNWALQLQLLGLDSVRSPAGSATLAAVGAGLVWAIWKDGWHPESANFGLRFAATSIVGLLTSPYLPIHDVSVAFLGVVLAFRHWLRDATRRSSHVLGIVLLSSPLAWLLTQPALVFRIQLTACWLTILGGLLWFAAVRSDSKAIAQTAREYERT